MRIDSKFIPQSLVSIKTDSYLATHSTDSTSLKKKNGNFTYKCLIDMQGGVCSPFGHINGLAKLELEARRTYIHENHKKGFIQPSKLHLGAPILLVKNVSIKSYYIVSTITASIKSRYVITAHYL